MNFLMKPNYQNNIYAKRKQFEGANVSAEKYADMIFQQAFKAPFTLLEQGETNLKAAYDIVDTSAYLQEKICKAWGKLNEELQEGSEYHKLIKDEKDMLEAENKKLQEHQRISEESIRAKIGYFKLALILEKIAGGKGKSEELEV